MNCETNSRKVGSFFVKVLTTCLLFYSVNPNAMLLQSQHVPILLPLYPLVFNFFNFCDYFVKNVSQVEIWSKWTHSPKCPAHRFFTEETQPDTAHDFFFLSDGKLNATGCCFQSSVSYLLASRVFRGSQRAFNVGRSAVLFL